MGSMKVRRPSPLAVLDTVDEARRAAALESERIAMVVDLVANMMAKMAMKAMKRAFDCLSLDYGNGEGFLPTTCVLMALVSVSCEPSTFFIAAFASMGPSAVSRRVEQS